MKTNADVRGGQLRKECYGVYADYFVRYVEAMRDHGIDIRRRYRAERTPQLAQHPQYVLVCL